MRSGAVSGRFTKAAVSALLAVAAALPALAQNSGLASNIAPSDTRSSIAPRLPAPDAGRDAGPRQYLIDARMALREGRTGAAQEALERAETRLLDSIDQGSAGEAARTRLLAAATEARQALGAHDTKGAETILNRVLAVRVAEAAPPPGAPPMEPELAYPMASRWAWTGARWAPSQGGEPPAPARWVPAHWVWRGAWVMAPGHWQ